MYLLWLYAASVVGAFIGWYACGPIKATSVRCIARASLVAFLCAHGVLVGHGIGVAPTLFALTVQPPPSVQEFFIDGYIFKYVLFGLIHAMLIVVVLYSDDTYYYTMPGIGYALFFSGAAINFVLCFRAVTTKNANPYLVPVLFAALFVVLAIVCWWALNRRGA